MSAMGLKNPLNAVSMALGLALFACACTDDGGEEGASDDAPEPAQPMNAVYDGENLPFQ